MLKFFLLLSFIITSSFATVNTTASHLNKTANSPHKKVHNQTKSQDTNTSVEENEAQIKNAMDTKGGYTTGLNRPKVGLYITSLDNFDTKNGSYDVIFWSWFIYDASQKYKSDMTTELTNIKEINILQNIDTKVEGNRIWNTRKVKATLSHNWDFKNYPFDTQKLTIHFEDGDYDYRDLRFDPDIKGSKIDKDLKMEGWNIKSFKLEERKHVLETNFGDPSLTDNQSVYSELVATVEIERNWIREFINNFGAIYIAFLILALSYMFKDAYSEKLSLFLTSIFLLIGNKAIIDDRMPTSNVVTLVDKIQLITFIIATIFITILAITIALDANGHKKLEYKINQVSMYTLIPLYIIINIYMIQASM